MWIILTIIFGLLFLTSCWVIRNLVIKQEKSENILIVYMDYLNKIDQVIVNADKRLKEIDSKGSFESDDEVGFFFKQIKFIQEILNNFQIKKI